MLTQLGLDPGALLTKAEETVALHIGGKAAKLAEKQIGGATKAILSHWNSTVQTRFPAYLQSRLHEVDACERPKIIEAAFSDWVASRTSETAELTRLLFRLIYLRALIDHCIELPLLEQCRLSLDDVWVPQTFRQLPPDSPRHSQVEQARFFDLEEAISTCGSPLVLLGGSGAGKSTQLRKLVLDVARRQLDLTNFEQLIAEPLPIYIQAETMASEPGDLTTTLSQVITRELGLRLPFPLPDGLLDSRQPGAAASLLVMIDGFDEISPERRDTLVASLRRHGDVYDVVLGSRARFPQHNIAHVEIEEPTSAQADALLHKLTELGVAVPGRWSELPRNPLILTLAALLQRQDSLSRATLYREFLLDRMSSSLDPAVPNPIDKADGATALHHLGFKAEARSILFNLTVQAQHGGVSRYSHASARSGPDDFPQQNRATSRTLVTGTVRQRGQ